VFEKEPELARHQTGRKSGVIHAGVYYQPGSLKAQFCKEGAARTLEFCKAHEIAVEQCGKLIVTNDAGPFVGFQRRVAMNTEMRIRSGLRANSAGDGCAAGGQLDPWPSPRTTITRIALSGSRLVGGAGARHPLAQVSGSGRSGCAWQSLLTNLRINGITTAMQRKHCRLQTTKYRPWHRGVSCIANGSAGAAQSWGKRE
jgi:hypothetical protein